MMPSIRAMEKKMMAVRVYMELYESVLGRSVNFDHD